MRLLRVELPERGLLRVILAVLDHRVQAAGNIIDMLSQGPKVFERRTTGRGEGGFATGGGEACRGGKLSGDEVRLVVKAFDAVLTGEFVPVRGIGDEPPDSCEGD